MTKTTIFLSSCSFLLYSPWSGYTRDIQKYIWALFLVVPLYNLHVIGEDSLPPIHTRIGARAIHQKFLFNSHILGPYHTHSVTSPLIYTHREDVVVVDKRWRRWRRRRYTQNPQYWNVEMYNAMLSDFGCVSVFTVVHSEQKTTTTTTKIWYTSRAHTIDNKETPSMMMMIEKFLSRELKENENEKKEDFHSTTLIINREFRIQFYFFWVFELSIFKNVLNNIYM